MIRWLGLVFVVLIAATAFFLLGNCSSTPAAEATVELAPGWQARLDHDSSAQLPRVKLAETSGGILAENGPNVVFWKPTNRLDGRYSLTVEVHHLDSHGHPHGAGLIFGGADLNEDAQTYSYFLVRGDGKFLIKTREGEATKEIRAWTEHPAIRKDDASGKAENKMRVEVGATETRFLVNDVEIHRAANTALHTKGIYGFRMVHDLKVLFARFELGRP